MDDLRQVVKDLFAVKYVIAHDFKHAQKVAYFAKLIAKDEGYDELEAEAAGILHDIGRTLTDKNTDHGKVGVPLARELMDKYLDFSQDKKQRILDAIEHHSDKTTVGKLVNILQDADKLDGMGAIGILRGATHKHHLEDYNENALNIKHFEAASHNPQTVYEQILHQARWVTMLYTDTARKIAQRRYEFMEEFLKELRREIEETE